MCGYHELVTPCCHEKTGFTPSPHHQCPLYAQNNRYCRTGSIHSWVVPSNSITSRILCDNCKKTQEHEIKEIERELQEKKKADEDRRKGEEARELRVLEKEVKRRGDGRKEERQSAAAALRSQMAGLQIQDVGDGSLALSRQE